MKLLSSRDFNRDVSHAKRAARSEPVLITDRGRPTHVLMSIADFRRYTGESENILDILAMPDPVDLDVDEAAADGTWDTVLATLLAQADAEGRIEWTVSVDATINRAHQHATNTTRPEQDTGGTVELHEFAGRVRVQSARRRA